MKKIFCFLAVASTAFFTSCSSDDDSNNNNNEVTSITVTSDNSTVVLGETFTFTVKNNLNDDVTSESTIYVNDVEQEDNTFTATAAGTYTVHATMGDFTSADITVTVTENPATSVTVAVSATTVMVGEEVTFTATTNQSVDVTNDATFFVNGVAVEGNTFTPDAAATYTVHAEYMELTSAEVTFVAEEEASTEPDNSVIYDGTEYTTDQSILYYLGTDMDLGLSYWVANPYNQVGEGAEATYPNDVYIYFTSAQVSTTTLDLPTLNGYTLGDDATVNSIFDVQVLLNEEEIVADATTVNSATMTMTSLVATDTEQNWAFNYELALSNGNTLVGDFSGDFGFSDETGGGNAAGRTKKLSIKKVNQTQVKKNLNKVLSKR